MAYWSAYGIEFWSVGFEISRHLKHLPVHPENRQDKYVCLGVQSLGDSRNDQSPIDTVHGKQVLHLGLEAPSYKYIFHILYLYDYN